MEGLKDLGECSRHLEMKSVSKIVCCRRWDLVVQAFLSRAQVYLDVVMRGAIFAMELEVIDPRLMTSQFHFPCCTSSHDQARFLPNSPSFGI